MQQAVDVLEKILKKHQEKSEQNYSAKAKVKFSVIDFGPLIFEDALQKLYEIQTIDNSNLEIPFLTRPRL